MAYFDYNATTPLSSAGKQALLEGVESHWANPSSPYHASAQVHNALEEARESLARRLQKSPEDIVFTGGATEANNAIIQYFAQRLPAETLLVVSPFEHPSVLEAADALMGERVHRLKALSDGRVDFDDLKGILHTGKVAALSLMAVNNESGVVQPWQKAAELCRQSGVLFHCDASQWFGKCQGDDFSGCDFVIGCAHKFGGPKGAGFVGLSANSHGFQSQLGGGQESGRRGGTENVASLLSMVAAMEAAENSLEDMIAQSSGRDAFEDELGTVLLDVICIGKTVMRVPNTSFLVVPQFENVRWVRKLDLRGFQVSTGSACSTGSTHSSTSLEALGYPEDAGRRTIRVSAGPTITESDWQALATAFREVWEALQNSDDASNTEVI